MFHLEIKQLKFIYDLDDFRLHVHKRVRTSGGSSHNVFGGAAKNVRLFFLLLCITFIHLAQQNLNHLTTFLLCFFYISQAFYV